MAKVSLRNYNRQIETLIDEGQLEEAVGHCNHILKTFPKHLETYQLLGKAYLEAKRHQDANDVFSRLLAAVPNDFVAHVGMSMIHDENKRLDDAIWHMERAFEAQPSNAAVQSELQRLYGSRDGVQPPKIRMTSGALAQVYVQGELYPQAIAEIMSVEAKDPGRADMQVLLALAYFRSDQRVEASKVASDLLSKSPYCLDANRILVTILPETSRAESTQVYRHRVNALDPYAAFAKSSIFDTSDVPDAAVNIERLEWQPGDTVFDDTGNWASTQADGDNNEQPDWLKETDTNAEFESASAPEPPAQPADDIPDFMRAAGWGTSSGEAEEATSFFDSPDSPEATNDDDEPIAQAELPDWMKNIAPDQAELEAANTETEDIGDAMADDWINDLLGSDDEEKPQDTSASDTGLGDLDLGDLGTSSEEQDAAMNWLESLAANQGANPEELITDPNARTESAPEWVQKAANTSNEAPAAAQPTSPPAAEEDDMDWLNELGGEKTSAPAENSAEPASDLPDWLSDLGGAEEAPPEPAEQNAVSGDLPDWLNDLGNTEETQPEVTEPAAEKNTGLPDWLNESPQETANIPDQESDAVDDDIAWLNDFATEDDTEKTPGTSVTLEAVAEETSASEDDLAWMSELTSEDTSTPVEPAQETPAETSIPTQPRPDAVSDATIGTLGTSDADQDAAMNWLESLAANQGANPEELITDPSTRTEAAPEWVEKAKDVSESANAAEETPAIPEPDPEDDLSWMNELSDEDIPASVEPVQEASKEEDLAWMNELTSEETSTHAADSADDVPEWLRETDKTPAEPANEEPVAETAIPTQPISDATIGTLGTSDADQDAAMNWLESLAANQGANPDELITDPNARTEAAPEWVEKAKNVSDESTPTAEETPTAPEPANEDDLSWMNELSDEETPAAVEPVQEAPAAEEEEDDDDDLAWMNELASEETSTHAADSADDVPEWLRETDETPVEPAHEEPVAPPVQEATSPTPAETAIPTQPISDATIGTLGTSDADQDAAMNWLESLAANQGANPDELITDPNARTEAAPEWVEKAKDVSEIANAAEETPTTPEPAIEDDISWMNELSNEETPAPVEPLQEAPAAAEDDDDDLAWMNELTSEEISVSAADSDSADDGIPEWLRDETAATPEPAPESDDDIPAWLRDTAEKTPIAPTEVEEEAPVAPPVEEAAVNEPKAEADEEKWLAEQAEAKLAHEAPAPIPPSSAPATSETESDETLDWLKDIASDEEAKAAASTEKTEEMPSWLADMSAEEEEKEKPAAPSNDFSAWLEDDTPPKQAATPVAAKATKPEEWKPIKPAEEEKPEPPRDLPPRRKVNRMNTTMLRDITLMSAQAAMREGNVTASLAEYGKMIKKKRLLDETIYDLREALYDYPVDVSIWQMLGDAYMRAGRLQEAINAYTKAEELLR